MDQVGADKARRARDETFHAAVVPALTLALKPVAFTPCPWYIAVAMRKLLAALALLAWAPLSPAQQLSLTAVPYVHPNLHTIDMSVGANWSWNIPDPMPRAGNMNLRTQFQSWNGVPMNVAGYSRSYRSFGRQRVPFLGRAPFVGRMFQNNWQTRSFQHSNFSFRTTLVDPAGNPVFRQGTQPFYRVPGIPRMHGLVP